MWACLLGVALLSIRWLVDIALAWLLAVTMGLSVAFGQTQAQSNWVDTLIGKVDGTTAMLMLAVAALYKRDIDREAHVRDMDAKHLLALANMASAISTLEKVLEIERTK